MFHWEAEIQQRLSLNHPDDTLQEGNVALEITVMPRDCDRGSGGEMLPVLWRAGQGRSRIEVAGVGVVLTQCVCAGDRASAWEWAKKCQRLHRVTGFPMFSAKFSPFIKAVESPAYPSRSHQHPQLHEQFWTSSSCSAKMNIFTE